MPSWYQNTNRFNDPIGAFRIAQYVDILRRFPVGHLVDLGAGHGTFSKIAIELGWRVTAVDARDVRFPEDANARWVVSDVREFDDYGDVDLVVCLGLWYHLSVDDQIALAAKIAPLPLVLDTHVATALQSPQHRSRVGAIGVHRGYTGRLYDESDIQHEPTASFGNLASFWPSLVSLEHQMYDAGYDVFEQVQPAYLVDRGFFIARSLGDTAARTELDELVSRYSGFADESRAPSGSRLPSLTPQLSTTPVPTAAPARPAPTAAGRAVPTLPIRDAAAQFAVAAKASAERKVRQGRRAWRSRAGR